jgi:hypothetical protein
MKAEKEKGSNLIIMKIRPKFHAGILMALIFAIVCTAASILSFILGVLPSNELRKTAIRTDATITRIESVSRAGSGYSTIVYITFFTENGDEIHTTYDNWFSTGAVGNTVPVLYNPAHPESTQAPSSGIVIIVLTLAFAVFAVVCFIGFIQQIKPIHVNDG